MAHQNTGDVETPLRQSVVDETTGVDEFTSKKSLTSGEAQGTAKDASNIQTKSDSASDGISATGSTNGDGAGKSAEVSLEMQHKPSNVDQLPNSKATDEGDSCSGSGAESSSKANNETTKSSSLEGNTKVARMSAVKKPTSFKAVINKHFLEKASSTGPVAIPSKPSFALEKPSSMVQQSGSQSSLALSSAKPRLVTRTAGFGLRDSSPGAGGIHQSAGNGQKKGAEAQRTVWTKNQPPPVTSQKELSDEELKTTYGIHLASRLQSDDGGKETKWADADDDDDWMPEAVEWSDGTKIQVTLQPSEDIPAATPATPGFDPGSSIPNSSERPTTIITEQNLPDIAKPIEALIGHEIAAPPPHNSPWASMPTPSQPSPFNSLNQITSDANNTGHQPFTKQVHADDFSRSWRDRAPSSRELFNSETGQLEPVHDRRNKNGRFSRPDWQLKQSTVQTVLQRPASQLSSPAEPSPAFQQHRSSLYRPDDYRRRRTSSNVSGGSGSTGRRLSFSRGIGHGQDQPIPPEETTSPCRQNSSLPSENPSDSQSSASISTTQQSIAQEQPIATSTASVEENPLVFQQRIMKETNEAARRRKIEEAAAEKAEQQRRIKERLEMLEKREAEKKEAAAAAAAASSAQEEANNHLSTPRPASPQSIDQQFPPHQEVQNQTNISSFPSPSQVPSQAATTSGPQSPTKIDSTFTQHSPYRSPVKHYAHPVNCESPAESWKPASSSTERYVSWGHTAATNVSNQPMPASSRGNPWGPVGEKSRHSVLDSVGNGSYDSSQFSQYGKGSLPYQAPTSSSRYTSTPSEYPLPPPERPSFGRMPSPVRRPPHLTQNFQRDRVPLPSAVQMQDQRLQAISQWHALPERLQRDEADEKERLFRQQQRAIEDAEARGLKTPIAPPRITEKWRKVDHPPGSGLSVPAVEQFMHESHHSFAEKPVEHPAIQQPQRSLPPHLRPQVSRQMSRFFPESLSDEPLHDSDDLFQTRAQLTASPPPGGKPIVHLPSIYPNRRKSSAEVTSPILANGHFQNGPHRQDNSTSRIEALQMKIKALVHHSPESKVDIPLASATKPFFDETRAREIESATVALPPDADGYLVEHDNDVGFAIGEGMIGETEPWTKPSEEGLLSELYVQDFGSQPTVNIPINIHYGALDKPIPSNQSSKLNKKTGKLRVETIPIILQDLFPRERFITIRLPASTQTKDIPFTQNQNSRTKNKWSRGKQNRVNSYRDYSYRGIQGAMHALPGRAVTDPVQ